ncbi:MAG: AEC family transporter [Synechococcales bacterium]|nr:AEC family transporter [Synechococcales bacterium]
MIDTLIQAYTPLLVWVGLGLLLVRWLPDRLPRWLGRSLYWFGVPWQIFDLARHSQLSGNIGLVPGITLATLMTGLLLAWGTLKLLERRSSFPHSSESHSADPPPLNPPLLPFRPALTEPLSLEATQEVDATAILTTPPILAQTVDPNVDPTGDPQADQAAIPAPGLTPTVSWSRWVNLPTYQRYQYGSFIIAGMLGNTGFVGLGILPAIINPEDYSWAVFFSLTQNLIGTYGIGVLVASHFGRMESQHSPWTLLWDLLTVPTLWAFALGYASREFSLPVPLELFTSSSLLFVIPASFLLMGMRLGMMTGWQSFQNAVLPVGLKLIVLPAIVGLGTTLLGLRGDVRLALVLMSGMPSAFASLILAEEYDMDRDLSASSIAISTIGLLLMIPVWLWIF